MVGGPFFTLASTRTQGSGATLRPRIRQVQLCSSQQEIAMNRKPQNSGKPWSLSDMKRLRDDIRHHTPARMIAMHLKRTVEAIYAKASEMHWPLRPAHAHRTAHMPRMR